MKDTTSSHLPMDDTDRWKGVYPSLKLEVGLDGFIDIRLVVPTQDLRSVLRKLCLHALVADTFKEDPLSIVLNPRLIPRALMVSQFHHSFSMLKSGSSMIFTHRRSLPSTLFRRRDPGLLLLGWTIHMRPCMRTLSLPFLVLPVSRTRLFTIACHPTCPALRVDRKPTATCQWDRCFRHIHQHSAGLPLPFAVGLHPNIDHTSSPLHQQGCVDGRRLLDTIRFVHHSQLVPLEVVGSPAAECIRQCHARSDSQDCFDHQFPFALGFSAMTRLLGKRITHSA